LEQKHEFRYISGLAEYRGGHLLIRPYNLQDIDGCFWAVTRYERGENAIELSYGDKDYALDIHFIFGHTHRFSLHELLRAGKKNPHGSGARRWIQAQATLEEHILALASLLFEHEKLLLEPDEKLIDRAMTMRQTNMHHQIHEQYQRELRESAQKAAQAFLDRDYRRVIELMAPYERHLSSSDVKKLKLARRYLLENVAPA
jgi:hypothetical protein